MKINLFGKKSIASAILVSAVTWITFQLRHFELPENFIWKVYYEAIRIYEENPVDQTFQNLLLEILKILEIEIDKNPELVRIITKNYTFLWDLYLQLKTKINPDWLKDSPITREIKDQINRNINNTPELLNYKVKRDVDRAIARYEKQIHRPINMKEKVIIDTIKNYSYTQKLIVEDAVYYEIKSDSSLGNTMGIRGAWTEPVDGEITVP
jgi:hypothetical protein